MSKRTKGLRTVLREITHSAERSPLFWWMVENHDELAAAAAQRRLRWPRLCARFAELKLTDVTGKVASERTARATWGRARREVALARQRLAAQPPPRPGAKYPSRISPNWRPQVVTTPSALLAGGPGNRATTQTRAALQHGASGADKEFPTTDPSGAPLAEGYVWYHGEPTLRHVAEQYEKIHRQGREMDRFK